MKCHPRGASTHSMSVHCSRVLTQVPGGKPNSSQTNVGIENCSALTSKCPVHKDPFSYQKRSVSSGGWTFRCSLAAPGWCPGQLECAFILKKGKGEIEVKKGKTNDLEEELFGPMLLSLVVNSKSCALLPGCDSRVWQWGGPGQGQGSRGHVRTVGDLAAASVFPGAFPLALPGRLPASLSWEEARSMQWL